MDHTVLFIPSQVIPIYLSDPVNFIDRIIFSSLKNSSPKEGKLRNKVEFSFPRSRVIGRDPLFHAKPCSRVETPSWGRGTGTWSLESVRDDPWFLSDFARRHDEIRFLIVFFHSFPRNTEFAVFVTTEVLLGRG